MPAVGDSNSKLSNWPGHNGPYTAPNGATYCVVAQDNGSGSQKMRVMKASVPTTSWAAVNTAGELAATSNVEGFEVFLVGSTLHVFYYLTTGSAIRYATLDTASDLWTLDESVIGAANAGFAAAVRDNGQPVIFYKTATGVSINTKTAGSWVGSETVVAANSSFGGAGLYPGTICVGAADGSGSNRLHLFFTTDATVSSANAGLFHRALQQGSTSSFEAIAERVNPAYDSTHLEKQIDSALAAVLCAPGASHSSGGGVKCRVAWATYGIGLSTGATNKRFAVTEFDDGATPTYTHTFQVDAATPYGNANGSGGNAAIRAIVTAIGTTDHVLWIDAASQDVYRDQNTGGGYGTDTTGVLVGTLTRLNGRVYDGVHVGMLYQEAAGAQYTEVSLLAAAAASDSATGSETATVSASTASASVSASDSAIGSDGSAIVGLVNTLGRTSTSGPAKTGTRVTVTDDTSHNAFGGGVMLPTGQLLAVYRKASGHGGIGSIKGKLITFDTAGAVSTVGSEFTILSSGTYDLRDIAAQGLSDGSIVISYYETDGAGGHQLVRTIRSTDGGQTWAAPVTVPTTMTYLVVAGQNQGAAVTAPVVEVPGSPGRLVLPIHGANAGQNPTYVWTEVPTSTDYGQTWSTGAPVAPYNGTTDYVEPNIEALRKPDGTYRLVCMLRSDVHSLIRQSFSDDGGATWSTPTTAVTQGTGRPAVKQLPDGGVVLMQRDNTLVFPAESSPVWHYSSDLAQTWGVKQTIDTQWPHVYGQWVILTTDVRRTPALGLLYALEPTPGVAPNYTTGGNADIYFQAFTLTWPAADSGTGSEGIAGVSIVGTPVSASDTGTGTDSSVLSTPIAKTATETASGTEATSLSINVLVAALTAADTAIGYDLALVEVPGGLIVRNTRAVHAFAGTTATFAATRTTATFSDSSPLP